MRQKEPRDKFKRMSKSLNKAELCRLKLVWRSPEKNGICGPFSNGKAWKTDFRIREWDSENGRGELE